MVNHAFATRVTLPITQNILLSAKESKLKLSATNLEVFITTWADAAIQEEGEITVPARVLTELVNSLPNERIDLDLPEGSGLLQLTCARAKAHINGADAKEFPPIPEVDEGITVLMDPQALRTAISRTPFAAATEDSRPVLTGVEMKLSGSKFTMAAADGFRLAVHRGEPDATPVRLIVRRVKPTPGSQLALFAIYSYHGFITDRDGELLELEADHRRHAEIENAIRDLKYGVGLNHLPSGRFATNAACWRYR